MIFYNITIAIFAHASASAKALWWFENGMPRKSQSDGREKDPHICLEMVRRAFCTVHKNGYSG